MIRLSYGSLVLLGLKKAKLKEIPTTIYAILGENCLGKCPYCEQSRSGNKLGMVTWYEVDQEEFLKKLSEIKGSFYRVCFEVLYYNNFIEDLANIVRKIKDVRNDLIVSATTVSLTEEEITTLKNAGLDSLGIGLDCVSRDIFDRIKGKQGKIFRWTDFWKTVFLARKYFDEVTVHVIVGLRESDVEIYRVLKAIKKLRAKIALFNYVRPGRKMGVEPPRYHTIQIMKYLLDMGEGEFEFNGSKLQRIYIPESVIPDIMRGAPFMTSGCVHCNRPYYTEHPLGHMYNYPRLPQPREVAGVLMEVGKYVELVKLPQSDI